MTSRLYSENCGEVENSNHNNVGVAVVKFKINAISLKYKRKYSPLQSKLIRKKSSLGFEYNSFTIVEFSKIKPVIVIFYPIKMSLLVGLVEVIVLFFIVFFTHLLNPKIFISIKEYLKETLDDFFTLSKQLQNYKKEPNVKKAEEKEEKKELEITQVNTQLPLQLFTEKDIQLKQQQQQQKEEKNFYIDVQTQGRVFSFLKVKK
jgi:hypothetical protein